jgi:hypothetical protein
LLVFRFLGLYIIPRGLYIILHPLLKSDQKITWYFLLLLYRCRLPASLLYSLSSTWSFVYDFSFCEKFVAYVDFFLCSCVFYMYISFGLIPFCSGYFAYLMPVLITTLCILTWLYTIHVRVSKRGYISSSLTTRLSTIRVYSTQCSMLLFL